MTTDNKDPLGIGHWPRWKQIAFFFLAVTTLLAIFSWIAQAYESYAGSPEARAIKAQIEPLAEQLEKAQKIGDQQAVIALLDPTTKIVRNYNDLNEAKKAEINNSPLRYCLLAAINLSDGVREVLNTGYWIGKDKYKNSLDMCK